MYSVLVVRVAEKRGDCDGLERSSDGFFLHLAVF